MAQLSTARCVYRLIEPGPSVPSALHGLWFAAMQRAWTSLVVVPADSAAGGTGLAELLVATAQHHGERVVSYLDARRVPFAKVHEFTNVIKSATSCASLIIGVDPLAENAATAPLIQSASAAILVVRRGKSRLAAARHAIHLIGRERLIGVVTID